MENKSDKELNAINFKNFACELQLPDFRNSTTLSAFITQNSRPPSTPLVTQTILLRLRKLTLPKIHFR
jgi:hypothetical protein